MNSAAFIQSTAPWRILANGETGASQIVAAGDANGTALHTVLGTQVRMQVLPILLSFFELELEFCQKKLACRLLCNFYALLRMYSICRVFGYEQRESPALCTCIDCECNTKPDVPGALPKGTPDQRTLDASLPDRMGYRGDNSYK